MENNTLAQFYQILSIVAFSFAGVCFAFAVFCFFKFNIVKIINDLTGRTAKKSIAKRRLENEKTGEKLFGPTPKAKERGKTTDKICESEKLMNTSISPKENFDLNATDKLDENIFTSNNARQPIEEGTEILSEATTALKNNNFQAETDVLPCNFKIIQNIVLIHTNEVIKL